MPSRRPLLAALALVAAVALAGARPWEPADPLVGRWKVDLRPRPDAPAYYQDFVVTAVEGNTFTGTFYSTPIEHARLNRDWGAVRFAFTTRDGSGTYHHSGVLEGNGLQGTTHSIGRDFLAVWTAERSD